MTAIASAGAGAEAAVKAASEMLTDTDLSWSRSIRLKLGSCSQP